MRSILMLLTAALLPAAPPGASAAPPTIPKHTPRDEYVYKPDPAYKWELVKTSGDNRSQTSVIKLTSQTWRTKEEVDRPVWEHWLIVVKPAVLKTNKAFLVISGGSNDRPAPEGGNAIVSRIAESTGSIVAELKMVPNEPLIFHGDGHPRKEDDLI